MSILFWHCCRGLGRAPILLLLQLVFALTAPLAAQGMTTTNGACQGAATHRAAGRSGSAAMACRPTGQRRWPPCQRREDFLLVRSRRSEHLDGMRTAVPRVIPSGWGKRSHRGRDGSGEYADPPRFALVLLVGYGADIFCALCWGERAPKRGRVRAGLAALIRIAPLFVFPRSQRSPLLRRPVGRAA